MRDERRLITYTGHIATEAVCGVGLVPVDPYAIYAPMFATLRWKRVTILGFYVILYFTCCVISLLFQ